MDRFYNRECELNKMVNIYNNLKAPHIIYINAPSGAGKTRLIHEFYNGIVEQSAFWNKIQVSNRIKEIEFIPQSNGKEDCIDSLFFVTRALERKGSISNYDFCFDRIRNQFSSQIPSIVKLLSNRQKNNKLAKSTFSLLLNFALPGSSDLINIINVAKDYLASSFDAVELVNDIWGRFQGKSNVNNRDYYSIEINNILSNLLNVFSEIYRAKNDFKIVLIIEDIHWIDKFSVFLIKEIFLRAENSDWPILFILSGWKEPLSRKNIDFNEDYFELREFLLGLLNLTEINLKPIHNKFINLFIKDRIRGLDDESCLLLSKRSNGDFDFLNDLIDEIIETPGWLNEKEELIVERKLIKELPSKAIEMAKARMRTYPNEIKEALYWSSLQGMNFDEIFINSLMKKYDIVNDLSNTLIRSDEEYGLIFLNDDPLLIHSGEFRRAAAYEACLDTISRNPKIDEIKNNLLRVYIDFYKTKQWEQLKGDKKCRYIYLFDELCVSIGISEDDILFIRDSLLLHLMQEKIIIGDYLLVISLANRLIQECKFPQLLDEIYNLLVDAYYFSGEMGKEKDVYVKWANNMYNKFKYNIKLARFMRRTSCTAESIKALNKALSCVSNTDDELMLKLELLKAKWASGDIWESYNELKHIEEIYRDNLENRNLYLKYCTAAYLILHDIDKGRQASIYASECVDRYLTEGDIQQTNIYIVNLSDSLWGVGYAKKAKLRLLDTISFAREQNLPQILDISLICIANICSDLGELIEADCYYKEGLQLAKNIGHDWDYIYGSIYYNLHKINNNDFNLIQEFSVGEEYSYLKELKIVHDLYLKFRQGCRIEDDYNFVIPVAKLNYYAILYNQNNREDFINSFAKVLSQMEGVKFNRHFIFCTIKNMAQHSSISPIVKVQLEQWYSLFCNEIENNNSIKIISCDYKICEARCCYDGAYLLDGESEMIISLVEENKDFFKFLPTKYIVESEWGNSVKGVKTAVKEFHYKRFDYPSHFNSTRCVFATNDGSCSLQKIAMEHNLHPFTFKPMACRLFPLETIKGEICPPSLNYEKDKYFMGVNYPGYVNYTPCGINSIVGREWSKVLSDEICMYDEYKKQKLSR